MAVSWQQKAVEVLLDCKREGVPWPDAQKQASAVVRAWVPDKDQIASSLFDQQNTQAAFFWRVAESAYLDVRGEPGSGDGPAIAWFGTGMAEDLDLLEAAA
jgi:hypothetical protein